MGLGVFDLTGKVAIVTGGYKGIGRGIANALARSGADIVVAARNLEGCERTASELRELGVEAIGVGCDVSNEHDVQELIGSSVNTFGQIDILVNNAGITGSAKPVVDMPSEEWHETLAVNLTGIFYCSRAAAKEMIKKNSGKIINVTSAASFMPIPHSGDYCASKGGALLLTKVLALELIKHHIQVNAICPGYFATDLNPTLSAKVEREVKKRIPAGRVADVSEIGGLAVFLASSASDYMVGAAVPIDGGVLLK